MEFRTAISLPPARNTIDHGQSVVMIGSCFTDNVGERMMRDGFNVYVNPMGVLYNPFSIARVINRAISDEYYTAADLYSHDDKDYCLDFKAIPSIINTAELLKEINRRIKELGGLLRRADVWIITFGTSRVWELTGHGPVGNCHKLPGNLFSTRMMGVDEIVELWKPLINDRRIIFTVSPIRHTADGLHANQLSKARLLLAIEELQRLSKRVEYFPAYEIMNDDLRDYRFYAADMKHPSEVAIDYIYDLFSQHYYTAATQAKAREELARWRRSQHRPLL